MTTVMMGLFDNAKEKIGNGTCPFCNSKRWDIDNETTQRPSVKELSKLSKGEHIRIKELMKAECQECGYTAYFDYSKVTKK